MEDFTKRSIDELIEEYPQFVEELNESYEDMVNMFDIIFMSCSIEYRKNKIIYIHYKVFDCFFEYQFPKLFEKYKQYDRIRNQIELISTIYSRVY